MCGVDSVPPSLVYVTSVGLDTNLTTYTFSAASMGTEGATRKIIIGVGAEDALTGFTINSVTVGGVAAASVVTTSADTGSLVQSGLFIVDLPTGATADVVVTLSEACTSCGIAIWAAYDLTSSTPAATASQFQTSSANIVLSMNVLVGDLIVGVSTNEQSSNAATWAGLTEDAETVMGAEAEISAASHTAIAAATPLTIGCDWDNARDVTGCAAVFR